MKIQSAKTKQDIINLIHEAIRNIVSEGQLDKIAQAILINILVKRKEALPDPTDIPVSFVYDSGSELITRIEIDDATYDVAKL